MWPDWSRSRRHGSAVLYKEVYLLLLSQVLLRFTISQDVAELLSSMWLDGRTDGRTDEWMNGRTVGRTDGRMGWFACAGSWMRNMWRDEYVDECMEGRKLLAKFDWVMIKDDWTKTKAGTRNSLSTDVYHQPSIINRLSSTVYHQPWWQFVKKHLWTGMIPQLFCFFISSDCLFVRSLTCLLVFAPHFRCFPRTSSGPQSRNITWLCPDRESSAE